MSVYNIFSYAVTLVADPGPGQQEFPVYLQQPGMYPGAERANSIWNPTGFKPGCAYFLVPKSTLDSILPFKFRPFGFKFQGSGHLAGEQTDLDNQPAIIFQRYYLKKATHVGDSFPQNISPYLLEFEDERCLLYSQDYWSGYTNELSSMTVDPRRFPGFTMLADSRKRSGIRPQVPVKLSEFIEMVFEDCQVTNEYYFNPDRSLPPLPPEVLAKDPIVHDEFLAGKNAWRVLERVFKSAGLNMCYRNYRVDPETPPFSIKHESLASPGWPFDSPVHWGVGAYGALSLPRPVISFWVWNNQHGAEWDVESKWPGTDEIVDSSVKGNWLMGDTGDWQSLDSLTQATRPYIYPMLPHVISINDPSTETGFLQTWPPICAMFDWSWDLTEDGYPKPPEEEDDPSQSGGSSKYNMVLVNKDDLQKWVDVINGAWEVRRAMTPATFAWKAVRAVNTDGYTKGTLVSDERGGWTTSVTCGIGTPSGYSRDICKTEYEPLESVCVRDKPNWPHNLQMIQVIGDFDEDNHLYPARIIRRHLSGAEGQEDPTDEGDDKRLISPLKTDKCWLRVFPPKKASGDASIGTYFLARCVGKHKEGDEAGYLFWAVKPAKGGSIKIVSTVQAYRGTFLIYPQKKSLPSPFNKDMWLYPAKELDDNDPNATLKYDHLLDNEGTGDVWLYFVDQGNNLGPPPEYKEEQLLWPGKPLPPSRGHPVMHLTPHYAGEMGVEVDGKPVLISIRKPLRALGCNELAWLWDSTTGEFANAPIYPERTVTVLRDPSGTLMDTEERVFGDGYLTEPVVNAYMPNLSENPELGPLKNLVHLHHDYTHNTGTIPQQGEQLPGFNISASHPKRMFSLIYQGDRWRPEYIPTEDWWDAILCSDLHPGIANRASAKLVIWPSGACDYSGIAATLDDGRNYHIDVCNPWCHNSEVLPAGTRVSVLYDTHTNIWIVKWAQCPAASPDEFARRCDRCGGYQPGSPDPSGVVKVSNA